MELSVEGKKLLVIGSSSCEVNIIRATHEIWDIDYSNYATPSKYYGRYIAETDGKIKELLRKIGASNVVAELIKACQASVRVKDIHGNNMLFRHFDTGGLFAGREEKQ